VKNCQQNTKLEKKSTQGLIISTVVTDGNFDKTNVSKNKTGKEQRTRWKEIKEDKLRE
jgi:hypothetical protein